MKANRMNTPKYEARPEDEPHWMDGNSHLLLPIGRADDLANTPTAGHDKGHHFSVHVHGAENSSMRFNRSVR